MAQRKRKQEYQRICINLPVELVEHMDEYVEPRERGELIADALLDYLTYADEQADREARADERRERVEQFVDKLRESGRKAADLLLPG